MAKATSINEGLNPKQIAFCFEFMKDHNGTQAAIRAGYSEKTARVQASDLLTIPNIQQFIQKREAEIRAAAGITRERVMAELGKLAFLDPRKLYDQDQNLIPVSQLDDDTAASIAGVEVDESTDFITGEISAKTKKIKLSDKKGALDSLLKMEGWNKPDKVEQSGKIETIVTISRNKTG